MVKFRGFSKYDMTLYLETAVYIHVACDNKKEQHMLKKHRITLHTK